MFQLMIYRQGNEGLKMTIVYIEKLSGFRGDDVVLMSFDRKGLAVFSDLFRLSLPSEFIPEHPSSIKKIIFEISTQSNEIKFENEVIRFRITQSKKSEILQKLIEMRSTSVPCHDYIDIDKPVDTLVLSVDEYIKK
jgi:hypothetical protein